MPPSCWAPHNTGEHECEQSTDFSRLNRQEKLPLLLPSGRVLKAEHHVQITNPHKVSPVLLPAGGIPQPLGNNSSFSQEFSAVLALSLGESPTASPARVMPLPRRELPTSVHVPWHGYNLPDFLLTMEFLHSSRNPYIL